MSDYEQFSELKCMCGAFLLLSFWGFIFFSRFFTSFSLPSVFLLQVLSHECKRLLHRLSH